MRTLWLDKETFSELDLTEVGGYKYAAHESTEILLFAYALDDDRPDVWDVAADPFRPPQKLIDALEDPEVICIAHNANFDRTILGFNNIDLPCPPLERWRCTMAQALSHALPPSLTELCSVLNVPDEMVKQKDGRRLISLFTMPQAANRKIRRATAETHPDDWNKFIIYAAMDIVAMRECSKRMPTWNWNRSAIAEWHCDQRMNDRGFQVDTVLTKAGVVAAVEEKKRIATEFAEIVGNGIRPSQRAQFLAYLNERFSLHLDNTRRDTFEQEMRDVGMDPTARRLMELSIASNKTSTAKYAALDTAVADDGRFRGGLQFAGASRTRRWAGRLFQGQNLPARGLPAAWLVETYIQTLKDGTHDVMFGDELMRYAAAALRGCVIVPPRKKQVVADLANIEGRMLSWLADEQWKLTAFREYDAGTGPDLYNITATSIIGGDPWKVGKKDRNVFGKVPDLACGYRGGVAGFQTFAHAYGVRMADHWVSIQKMIAAEHVERAVWGLKKWGRPQLESLEISETEWLASETCKLAWRGRHPATVRLWEDIEQGCMRAIRNWGSVQTINSKLKVGCVDHEGHRWMCIRLPSNRFLTYFNPTLRQEKMGDRVNWTITYEGEAAEEGKTNRMWIDIFTHGGKITGNCCQTLSRDILAQALPEAEEAGYVPVLTVHDEAVTECEDDDRFDVAGLVRILSREREWAAGLPLSAAGFEGYRYKKED